nr:hypothetical protein [Micromonospora olivasterospora]
MLRGAALRVTRPRVAVLNACRSCGLVADVDCAVGETPCLTASDDNGFSIDEAEVVYWGRCPDCS